MVIKPKLRILCSFLPLKTAKIDATPGNLHFCEWVYRIIFLLRFQSYCLPENRISDKENKVKITKIHRKLAILCHFYQIECISVKNNVDNCHFQNPYFSIERNVRMESLSSQLTPCPEDVL